MASSYQIWIRIVKCFLKVISFIGGIGLIDTKTFPIEILLIRLRCWMKKSHQLQKKRMFRMHWYLVGKNWSLILYGMGVLSRCTSPEIPLVLGDNNQHYVWGLSWNNYVPEGWLLTITLDWLQLLHISLFLNIKITGGSMRLVVDWDCYSEQEWTTLTADLKLVDKELNHMLINTVGFHSVITSVITRVDNL